MYKVTITNNYRYSITASTGMVINPAEACDLGYFNGLITVPGIGEINVEDLGEDSLKGYKLNGKNGVLVRYKNIELYNRFDGEGYIYMMLDSYGDVSANARGDLQIIGLEELKIDSSYPV